MTVLAMLGALAFLVLIGLVGDHSASRPMWVRGLATLCAVAAPFVIAFALYAWGPYRRLGRIRKVLRQYPWEYRPSVRPCDAKDVMALLVEVQVAGGPDAEWSQRMKAINPLRRKRWTGVMEKGAWFAGDPEFGGVIAEPGGRQFMTLERRARMPLDEYRAIAQDRERMGRARKAGIGSLSDGGYN
ncbi:hypothetical protein P8605_02070 [Streptomyces sp. T-3]|nr:hypothetical protein [Streptomyces sp. T-3]